MNDPLTPCELRIAAKLLTLAAEKFSNHGSNDFLWPTWLTMEERLAFATAVRESQAGAKEATALAAHDVAGKLAPEDFVMMQYLSKRLEAVGKATVWHKVADEPPPEDEMVLLSWGGLEGSGVGYRFMRDGDTYYVVDGNTNDGDDPEWWMRIPETPLE